MNKKPASKFILGICLLALSLIFSTSSIQAQGWRKKMEREIGAHFPNPPVYREPSITPDLTIQIQERVIEEYILGMLGRGLNIPLSGKRKKKISEDYLRIRQLKGFEITDYGTIKISLSGRAYLKKFFSKINLIINEISIEIVPVIKRDEGSFFLDLNMSVTYLDVSSVPPILDKVIANLLLTEQLTSGRLGEKLRNRDISGIVTFEISHPISSGNINPPIKNVAISLSNNTLKLIGELP